MTLEEAKEAISKLHAGASYYVEYSSEYVDMNGNTCMKHVKRPVRLGVRYSHLKHMRGKQAGPLPGNGKWVIDRYVYEDSNGLKLRVTNGAFGRALVVYDGGEPRHKSSHRPIVQSIKLENVTYIGAKR